MSEENAAPELIVEEGQDLVEFVEEANEISDIIKRVVESHGQAAAVVYNRWKTILYKYQEQSQLLDAHLEEIVQPLSTLLRNHAVSIDRTLEDLKIVQSISRLLSILVVVRGYKTVVKFFPHEAQDLEKVLNVLEAVKAHKVTTAEDGIASWETQAVLLLWLSILILIPFELATVDSSTAGASEPSSNHPYTALVGRILGLCKDYLRHPGCVREMAALLLGRLLTRPDMGGALQEFLDWAQTALSTVDDLQAPFLVPGVLHTLSFIFKLGKRSHLLPHAHRVWALLSGPLVAGSAHVAASMLARKLSIKLLQRVALTFLEPRLAPWRYTRDHEVDLEATLAAGGNGGSQGASAAPAAGKEEGGEDEEYEVVEEVEEVIERLLQALKDRDTVVRWSAAKGVGRVTGCLPKELGDDVVEHVLELFKPTEGDTAWHGGCLALAELSRRGLLLPARLPAVVPIIHKALAYDVRRGPHSIGAHVRDAAAYVCWACARAYAPAVLENFVHVLASSLLIMACYDREVNCRRAAAAAFQEAVGRLGNFPHGIDILSVADYFSVGNVTQAYLRVAPYVSSFPEYRLSLADHLVGVKLRHWEKPLRELAAKAAASLVPDNGEYFSTIAFDTLLPYCLDAVLEVRHGAVLGVAELLPALNAAGIVLSAERQAQVANLVPAIDKARLYRGKGGEVMREAVSRLISSMSAVCLPLSKAQHAKVQEALDENLRHPHPYIQKAAVQALGLYTRAYIVDQADAAAAFTEKQMHGYMSRLHDPNVAVRRGYASALGSLPRSLLAPVAGKVLDALIDGTQQEEEVEERDVDSRVNCVRALGAVCLELYGPEQQQQDPGSSSNSSTPPADVQGVMAVVQGQVLPCLSQALQDYTIDNRGDVGSWVREACMEVLTMLLLMLDGSCTGVPQAQAQLADLAVVTVGALLKQAVERIARVREAAISHLKKLLASPSLPALIPGAPALHAALPTDTVELTGVASLETLPRLVSALLLEPAFTAPMLEGLIASIGGVDASLSKVASAALVDALAASSSSPSAEPGGIGSEQTGVTASGALLLDRTADLLLEIWSRHAKSPRMATPLLRTAHLLLTKTSILSCTVAAASTASGAAASAPASAVPSQQAQEGGEASSSTAAAQHPSCSAAPSTSPPHVPLSTRLVELTRAETRQCTDVTRLLDASALLCLLVPTPNPSHTSAVQGLLVLLVNRYPKVRRYTAEQLYVQLLPLEPAELGAGAGNQEGGSGVSAENLEAAQELLLVTSWDGSIDIAKEARDQLAGLLKVPVPAVKAVTSTGAKKVVRDENESYAALIESFARGF